MLDLYDARLFAGDEAPGGSGQNGTLIQHPASSIQNLPQRIGVVLQFVIAFLVASAVPGSAQEFEPRTYAVTPPGLNFVALAYGYGGQTTVDGVRRDTIQRNWRLAVLMAYPIRPNQGLSFSIGSGGNFGAGTDFDTISVGYQYSWGGR